jgi:hypothetical protein
MTNPQNTQKLQVLLLPFVRKSYLLLCFCKEFVLRLQTFSPACSLQVEPSFTSFQLLWLANDDDDEVSFTDEMFGLSTVRGRMRKQVYNQQQNKKK